MGSSASIGSGRRGGRRLCQGPPPSSSRRRRRFAPMLEVAGLNKRFGGLAAVRDIDTRFERGQISAIIGPNGAGKTTFFNLVSGFHRPTSGRVTFDGADVTGMRPDQIARLGVA